ncbi:hypothetical protein BB776_02305 [Planococcus salinarum]|uniref:Uncharacterized protein n=1 Tax=Planococcus salinarum TaxID=622695 RepID=A0ABX3D0U0_9BACL|nr:hypothetical protein BB776_02305 [Planococcus salinarum]
MAEAPKEKAPRDSAKDRKTSESVETEEPVEPEETEEPVEEENETSRFNKIYSNVASNRFENLRTSYIENKAKELRKKRK